MKTKKYVIETDKKIKDVVDDLFEKYENTYSEYATSRKKIKELEEDFEAELEDLEFAADQVKTKKKAPPDPVDKLKKIVEGQEERINMLESEIAELKELLDKHFII